MTSESPQNRITCLAADAAHATMLRERYGVQVRSTADPVDLWELKKLYQRTLDLGEDDICLPCGCCVTQLEELITNL